MLNDLAKGVNREPKSGSRDLRKSSDVICPIFSIHLFLKLHDYSEGEALYQIPKAFFLMKLFSLLRERKIATR